MANVGVDIGTFHTVAVSLTNGEVTVPRASVPSIALKIGRTPFVGREAIRQIDLQGELIQAPKLLLGSDQIDRWLLNEIISKLARYANDDLGLGAHENTVVTVPPGWDLTQCDIMSDALKASFPTVRFFHEPVALLVAAWWLAPTHADPTYLAKLTRAREIIVCDWGAGTVDLSAIEVQGPNLNPEFRCIGEKTSAEWGGTRIARKSMVAYRDAGHTLPVDVERAAFFLQDAWATGQPLPFRLDGIDALVTRRRQNAAFATQANVDELLQRCSSRQNVLFVMHGGPLESTELRDEFRDALETIGIARDRQIHIGAEFVRGLADRPDNLRRETLVALGAAVFAERGRALPEYQYRLHLRDGAGQESNSVKLAVTQVTKGVQAVKPPYTGVDYAVEVQQLRSDEPTPIRKELALSVRDDAMVLYRIAESGVGYAEVEAAEARDIPAPKPFSDAVTARVRMPEKSTRFNVNFARGR